MPNISLVYATSEKKTFDEGIANFQANALNLSDPKTFIEVKK